MNNPHCLSIPVITTNALHESIFTDQHYDLTQRGGLFLSPQVQTKNLRLRTSLPGYESEWHVSGEAVLIIIQQGKLRICLRNKEYKDFSIGMSFIANDRLPDSIPFNSSAHGHKASVIGDQALIATHIKLTSTL